MGSDDNSSNGNRTNGNGATRKGVSRPRALSASNASESISIRDIIGKVYAHKLVVILAFVAVVTAAAAYTFTRKPVYESSTEILITKTNTAPQSMIGQLSDFLQPMGSDQRRITDEMAILKTALLRNIVAHDLIENPILKVGNRSDTLQIDLSSKADRRRGAGPFAALGEVAGRLSGAVKFTNDPNSDIVDVTVRSHSSQEAAYIANVYAREYYNLNLSSSRTLATNLRKFLQKQLGDAQTALASAEDSLRIYMQSQHIVSLDQESNSLINAMSTVEAQRDDVVVEVESDQNVLDMYRAQLAKAQNSFSSHVSDALDPYIKLLQQQIAQLQVNRDVAIAQSPENANRRYYNRAVAQVDSQIASLQRKLREKTTEFLNSQVISGLPSQQGQSSGNGGSYDPTGYYTDLKLKVLQAEIKLGSAQAQEKALDGIIDQYKGEFSKIPKQYVSLAELERTEKSRSKLFLMIQDNYQQAQIAEQSQFGNVQIIGPAYPSGSPVSPRVPIYLAVGVIFGLAAGVGLAVALEQINGAIKSPEDLEKRGFNVLTAIPLIPQANETRGKSKMEKSVVVSGRRVPLRLVTIHSPSDPISEAYLSLRTTIQYSPVVGKVQSLLVVSSVPREGKSTTVANLSVALANAGLKTLMLDADLRKPILQKLWGVERRPGLVEYLKGKAELEEVVKKTSVENLYVLPAGSIPPNPSEMLGSDLMKATMAIMETSFDIVLIDSPPVLAVTDAAVLSRLSDAVLFVTSANSTRPDIVDKGSEVLRKVEANVIGYVLNQFDYRKAYGAYYGYKSYSQYYRRSESMKVNG